MPSWSDTLKRDFLCFHCGKVFQAKRDAKFCSVLCMSRNRPKRQYVAEDSARRRKGRVQKEGYRELVNSQARERRNKMNLFLREHKTRVGCSDCGFKTHHSALDFHHLGKGKEINISLAKSIGQASKEMRKCAVLCSNCHRIRHWKERYRGHPCKHDIFIQTYEEVVSSDIEGD